MRHARPARPWSVLLAGVLVAAAPARGVERKELEQFEERHLQKWVERFARAIKSERALFLKELDAAFPGKATDATTEQEYAGWFDLLAGRNDQWWRDDSPTPGLADLFDKAIQRLDLGPVPSVTREEFAKYAKRVLREQNPPAPGKEPTPDDDADKVFRALDRNGDGDLDDPEMTTGLLDGKLLADADGDGRVGKDEYRESFRRRAATRAEALTAKPGDAPRAAADVPPPKGRQLPEWFGRLDADRDGQLSLFECRTGGGSVTLFTQMDLNDDGFLTRDEYLRYAKELDEKLHPKPRAKR
jgi:Ca2+-binding EF-hand superfamily protein